MPLTAKATFKQLQGQQAVAVAQARIDIAHQAALEHGFFRRCGGQGGADVDHLVHGLAVQAQCAGAARCRPHRAPGAVRVHAGAQLGGRANARPHLITGQHPIQKCVHAQLALLAQRQHSRQHMHGGVAAREAVAFVHFQESAAAAIDHGRGIRGHLAPQAWHHCSTVAVGQALGHGAQFGFC